MMRKASLFLLLLALNVQSGDNLDLNIEVFDSRASGPRWIIVEGVNFDTLTLDEFAKLFKEAAHKEHLERGMPWASDDKVNFFFISKNQNTGVFNTKKPLTKGRIKDQLTQKELTESRLTHNITGVPAYRFEAQIGTPQEWWDWRNKLQDTSKGREVSICWDWGMGRRCDEYYVKRDSKVKDLMNQYKKYVTIKPGFDLTFKLNEEKELKPNESMNPIIDDKKAFILAVTERKIIIETPAGMGTVDIDIEYDEKDTGADLIAKLRQKSGLNDKVEIKLFGQKIDPKAKISKIDPSEKIYAVVTERR